MRLSAIFIIGLVLGTLMLAGCSEKQVTNDHPVDEQHVDDNQYQTDIQDSIDQETIAEDDYVEIGEMI